VLLDGVVVCILLIWTALGWRAGASIQAVRLGAGVAAFVVAAPLSGMTKRFVFGEQAVSTPMVEAASLLIAGVSVYIVCRLIGAVIVRAMHAASGALSWLDHLGGGALGLAKAMVASYFLVSVVYIGSGALESVDPEDALHIRDSVLLVSVERYNVLVPWQLASVGELQEALAVGLIAERTGQWPVVEEHPDAVEFLNRPSVERMLTNEPLLRSAYQGQYATVLADEDVRDCLSDRPCHISLQLADWSTLRDKLDPEGGLTWGDSTGG
jgi:uncharacterized membrane protein required for colicin V production